MISKGDKIDLSFEVKGWVAGERWQGPLSQLVTRPTVVSVYMRNNTSSCDRQTQQLAEAAPALDAAGIGVIALSKDTPGSHAKYCQKHGFTFPLVSDPDMDFAQATDSLVDKKLYGRAYRGPSRSAFLISPEGVALGLIEKVDSARHAEQLVALCVSE